MAGQDPPYDQIMRPVMATDSTGAVVWAASYLPFGGIDLVWIDTGALEQNLRFPGQWFQAGEPEQKSLRWSDFPANGLHRNGMRDYDPTTGRYLQADPLGLIDGVACVLVCWVLPRRIGRADTIVRPARVRPRAGGWAPPRPIPAPRSRAPRGFRFIFVAATPI